MIKQQARTTPKHLDLTPHELTREACCFVVLGTPDIIPGDTLHCNAIEFKVLGLHKRCLQDVYVSYVPLCGYSDKQEMLTYYAEQGINQREDFGKVCNVVFVVKV